MNLCPYCAAPLLDATHVEQHRDSLDCIARSNLNDASARGLVRAGTTWRALRACGIRTESVGAVVEMWDKKPNLIAKVFAPAWAVRAATMGATKEVLRAMHVATPERRAAIDTALRLSGNVAALQVVDAA